MKSLDFSNCLKQCAAFLEVAQSPMLASGMNQLAELFVVAGNKKVIDVVTKLDSIDVGRASFNQPKLDFNWQAAEALALFVKSIAPKAVADFESVAALLRRHENAPSEQWISLASQALAPPPAKKPTSSRKPATPANVELVDRYERILETALGDDAGFREAFARLENDENMRPAEVSVLAKRFAGSSVKARPAALKKIFARHQALMTSRAASAATAGRIAG